MVQSIFYSPTDHEVHPYGVVAEQSKLVTAAVKRFRVGVLLIVLLLLVVSYLAAAAPSETRLYTKFGNPALAIQ